MAHQLGSRLQGRRIWFTSLRSYFMDSNSRLGSSKSTSISLWLAKGILKALMTHVSTYTSYQVTNISICYFMLMICSAFKNSVVIKKLRSQLSSKFETKDLVEARRILSMEIEGDRKKRLSLTRQRYLKMLQKFHFDGDTKSVSTILAPLFQTFSEDVSENCWRPQVYISRDIC